MIEYIHENSNAQCQKKEGANPGQLFWAFGPHQQGAAQSLPGTAGLKYMYTVTPIFSLAFNSNRVQVIR